MKQRTTVLRLIAAILLLFTLAMLCTGCGKKYTCMLCGEKTSKAYYDWDHKKSAVMCEDCAHNYWFPLNITDFRVK